MKIAIVRFLGVNSFCGTKMTSACVKSVLQCCTRHPLTKTLSRSQRYCKDFYAYGDQSNCKISISDDQASFEARLPGWSSNAMSWYTPKLLEPWYLKTWRVPYVMNWTVEMMRRGNFLDFQKYEETHLVYRKCARMKRVVSVEEMNNLFYLPYSNGITLKCYLGRIGRSSLQLDCDFYLTDSSLKLFETALLYICVDINDRVPSPLPDWWVDKYERTVTSSSPLRLQEPRSRPAKDLLFSSKLLVQPLDVDYYGHVNNNNYVKFAMDGLLQAQLANKLPLALKQTENEITQMEQLFLAGSTLGANLEARVYNDSHHINKFYVDLRQDDTLYYSMSVFYDLLCS